jgi:hypothetical protein
VSAAPPSSAFSTRRPAATPGCWPTREQEWLLRAAWLDGAPSLEAWHAWQAVVDIEQIDPGSFRLLPLLQRNLARQGVTGDLMQRLRGVHRQAWFRNRLLFARSAGTVRALEDAGLDTLLLKGIPLALRYYREDATRPMADADVLVRTADVHRALDRLQHLGWRSQTPLPPWPPPHRASWAFRNDAGHEFDLHWHVFNDCLGARDDDDLWAAAVPLTIDGAETRALCAADQLLHVLAHGIHWNPLPSIRWVADAAAIIDGAGASLDWARLLTQAEQRQLMPLVAAGLPYLAQLLAAPIPPAVLTPLTTRRPTAGERLWLWARTTPGARSGLLRMWSGFSRASRLSGHWRTPAGFTRYLRELWLVQHPSDLPRILRDKLGRAWSDDDAV